MQAKLILRKHLTAIRTFPFAYGKVFDSPKYAITIVDSIFLAYYPDKLSR